MRVRPQDLPPGAVVAAVADEAAVMAEEHSPAGTVEVETAGTVVAAVADEVAERADARVAGFCGLKTSPARSNPSRSGPC